MDSWGGIHEGFVKKRSTGTFSPQSWALRVHLAARELELRQVLKDMYVVVGETINSDKI